MLSVCMTDSCCQRPRPHHPVNIHVCFILLTFMLAPYHLHVYFILSAFMPQTVRTSYCQHLCPSKTVSIHVYFILSTFMPASYYQYSCLLSLCRQLYLLHTIRIYDYSILSQTHTHTHTLSAFMPAPHCQRVSLSAFTPKPNC